MKNDTIKKILTAVMVVSLAVIACDNPTKSGAEYGNPDEISQQAITETYSHGGFTLSDGIYRIPYIDGTDVLVWQDHHTHGGDDGPRNRIDLTAGKGVEIVAAASGWIRGIVDHNGDTFGRGDGLAHDSLTVQDDSLEHACGNNNPDPEAEPPDPPNPIFGSCSQYNNYVWIEHPNGEWSKYTHFGTGTVTIDNGWQVDDWINAGEVLGLEDDIGQASGSPNADHLHFEIARPNDSNAALTWSTKGGFFQNGFNVVPLICDIPDHSDDGDPILEVGDTYTADACEHDPPTANAGGPYEVDEGSQIQLDASNSSDPEGLPLSGYLWESVPEHEPEDPWLIGDNTLEQLTFTAFDDAVVDFTLIVYDQVEALASAPDNTTVTINNVAPNVDAGPDMSVTSGESFTFVGGFSDPGVIDNPWSYEVDWGDGSEATNGTTNDQDATIIESHLYCASGPYTLSLSVTDKDGDTGMDDMQFTVDFLAVGMEIKPEGGPNPVNLRGGGVLPVVVYSSAGFDATAIDPSTVTLGDEAGTDTPVATRPNGSYMAEIEDVNDDGLADLALKFRIPELVNNGDLTNATTSLALQGFLDNACTNLRGEDEVTVKP